MLCRGSVTLLQVACPLQGPVQCRGSRCPVALNLHLSVSGQARPGLHRGGAELLGSSEQGGFWGCGCSEKMTDGIVLPRERGQQPWLCRVPGARAGGSRCRGGSQARAAPDAGTAPGTGEERGPGWAESGGGSKAAPGLCRECWGCSWGQSRGGGFILQGSFEGSSLGQLGLGSFGVGECCQVLPGASC